ncbi:hypothetical protein [Absidia glauca]|uniref:Vacuolar protein sorting-associated protein n=1 Tax=Absidia glauca TaxID=4829 RepID=A0A168MBD7_ABSGL|nr:hypothetical protein [Absidia glauca]
MLEALVTSILNRVLGSYVSNLNYDQLKIAVWNGEVNLHDLKLRKDALDKLHLPIDVVEGYLGELTLSIPWSNLKTKPVKVHIRNVYVLAAPKTEASVNFEDEEERAQQQKQQRLQKAELLDASKSDVKTLDDEKSNNGGGFVSQLTTKVIDNLQLSLENIHIRYEDTVSFPEHRFAAGVTLKELSAISTDDNWEAAFIGSLADTIHKLAKLESLSVYWNTNASSMAGLPHAKTSPVYTDFIPASGTASFDHQYIVKPVSGTGKIKLHKSYGQDKPNYDVTLLFDELGFCLDDEQYRDALSLVDLFHSNLKKQEYLKLRPPLGTTPKSKPMAYFKYAGNAVLSKIHERNYKWTWDHFKKRRDQRVAYIDCFVALKRNTATPQQKRQLDQLEWDLSFEDIRFYRSIAKNQLRKENIMITKQQKTTKKGWFNSLWNRQSSVSSSSSSDQTSSGTESDPVVLTDEQKQELCDVIDYDGYNDGITDAIDMPKDTMKFVLNTKLKRGSFGLVQHPHGSKQQISSIVFDTVGVEVIKYVESMKISAQLGDLQLYDGITENTIYPQLIGVKKDNAKESITLVGSNRRGDVPEGSGPECTGDHQPLLAVEYQQNPLDKKADKSIKLVMRHLEIIYNPSTIHGILSFFQSPSKNSESFDALIEVAGDTLEGFKRQTRAGLEYALENHSTLDLDVDIDAPIIIIPESCVVENSPVTIIDAGHIRIESDLANQDLAEEFKNNHTKDYSVEDLKHLEDLMYDKFHVGLTQIKLLVGQNLRQTMAQLDLDASDDTSSGGDTHVLRRVDIQLLLERCIVPGASQFTKLRVKGQAPLLLVNLSTQKYKTLMKAVDLLLSPSKDDTTVEPTIETQQQQDDLLAKKLWDGRKAKDLLADDENLDQKKEQSVKSLAISDSAIGSSQQNQIKLDFTITRMSVIISGTPTTPDSMDTPLCEIVLEQFGLEFVSRPYDMFAHVWLRALNVVDNMEHGKEYGYLVTSGQAQTATSGTTNNLVDVKYKRAKSTHPMFMQSFGGYEQSVDVLLSTLTFVITRESLITLYGWIMATFTDGPQLDEGGQQSDQTKRPGLSSRSTNQSSSISLWSKDGQQSRRIQQKSPASTAKPPKKTASMKVGIQMLGIQVILNENGVRLCTGILSSANLEMQLLSARLMVQGKIGSFVLTDDSSSAIKVDSDKTNESAYYLDKISTGKSDVKIISIDDSELLDFTFATFDPDADDFPGHHQHLYVRLGAFRLLYRDALKSISDFFTGFLEMKSVHDSARLTATTTTRTTGNSTAHNKSNQQKERDPSLFAFDIMMQSPIIIFPVGANHSSKVIAYLGQIHAKNEFVETVRPNIASDGSTPIKTNQIRCGLSSISLYSTANDDSKNPDSPILDKVDISVSIEKLVDPNQCATVAGPQTSIRGKISNVMMYLSEDQYRWLLEIQQRLSATFTGSSGKDQDNQGVESSLQQEDQASSVAFNDPPPDDIQEDSKPVIGTQLDLCFDMGLVCLELFNRSEQGIQASDQHSLGRLSFDSTSMKLEKMTNGPMVLDMQMRSINLYDTRYDSKSCFKDIFPAGKQLDGPQLQVHFKTGAKTEEGNDVTSVDVTLDRPQVVVSLDYMMLMKDFFAAPFETAPPPTEAQAYAASLYGESPSDSTKLVRPSSARSNSNANKSSAGQAPPKSTLHYKITVLDLELVCLAQPDTLSSEAMVLSFDKLSVIQQDKFDLQLNGIGLLLCRMDNRNESATQLVDRFDVGVDIQTLTSSTFKNTNINAAIQPIKLRFSYNNVMLILDIVKKVTALVGKSTNKEDDDGFAASSVNDVAADDDAHDSDLDHMLNMTSLLSEPGDGMTRQLYTSYRHSGDQKKQRRDKGLVDNTHGVKSRESLNARFEGLQLVIVEDLHDLAFLDLLIEPFNTTVSDWSSALVAHARISTQMNNFNFKTSHWEPLIEPYTFEFDATRATNVQSLDIGLSSDETLNMNLTHTFLDTVMAVSGTWSAIQPLPGSAQKQIKPFVIENRTGYDMQIWNLLDDNAVDEPSVCVMNDGQDQDWNASDWSKRNNSTKAYDNVVGIKVLHADWSAIPAIPIDVEGKRSYCLKNDTDDYQYRVVVEVKLEKHVKSVTFYGGLILENRNTSPMQITMMDQSRTLVSPIWTVAPNEVTYSPVGLAYRSWIAVRPSEEYAWCDAPLHWSDMTHPKARGGISCAALERNCPQYMYHLRSVFDASNAISRQHPMMKIIFYPPIEIVNHLPFDFKWTMMDQDSNRSFSSVIKYGSSEPLHTFYTGSKLAFVLDVLHDDYGMTEVTKIQPADAMEKEGVPIIVKTKGGDTTNLRMLLERGKPNEDSLRIEIYSPYIILNKSARPISFRFRDSSYSFKSVVSKHNVPACGSKVIPYMFSYPKISPKNRVELSFEGSKWSSALSFEAVGSAMDVCVQGDKSSEIHAGVHVEEGRGTYHLSKIVTITPRFVLKNDTDLNLKYAEFESKISNSLGIHGTLPLYTMTSERPDKWLCLQLDDSKELWSSPFDIQEIGTTFTKIPKGDGSRYLLMQVSVAMKNATIFITFKRATQWPYVIVNNSSTDVTFYQESCYNGGRSKNKKTAIQPTKYSLSPEQKYMKYSWDMPAAKDRRLVLDIGGKTRTIDLHAIGTQIPFRYKKHHPDSPGGSVSIDISSHNSSLVLLLTDFKEENSLFRSKSTGESTTSSSSSSVTSAPDHFEPVDIEVVDNYSFGLQLRGVGISVVNSSSQEIIYASIKNMNFKYTDSNLYQSIRTSIDWIQIDNQLFGSPYPILFYPTTLRKDSPPNTDAHPALHLALDKVKDNSHGVTYFKIFSILLQEMTVELDEDLLYALIEFSQFKGKSDEEISNAASDLHNAELGLPTEEPNQALLFFEQFCIQPMRLNVSFATTAGTGTTDASTSANSPIGYLLDVLTMTIGNINARGPYLSAKVTTHYKNQFVYQIHRLVGSADLLGNPVGLFTSIGSGVGELFYEPYQGFITSNRPQDFGIGIARGVGGLLKNSVFGLTDSLSKVTGSLGKGLAMATMDKKFQDRRRMKMTRNKPQHAIFGVTQGVTYLGTSLASGVVGLVKRPMEGASESGVGGFFGGVGKGLVGVVTKPVVGICDLASNVTVGLRETTTLFEEGALVKERLPRYTGKDGTLRIFSQQEALGQMWMKEMADGYYNKETYIAHTLTDDEKHACILTWQYLFAINTQKLGVDWFKKLDDLESCTCTTISDKGNKKTGNNNDAGDDTPRLMIQTKDHPPQNKYINFLDPASAPWFTKQVQNTKQQRMEAREQ